MGKYKLGSSPLDRSYQVAESWHPWDFIRLESCGYVQNKFRTRTAWRMVPLPITGMEDDNKIIYLTFFLPLHKLHNFIPAHRPYSCTPSLDTDNIEVLRTHQHLPWGWGMESSGHQWSGAVPMHIVLGISPGDEARKNTTLVTGELRVMGVGCCSSSLAYYVEPP